MRLSRKLGGLLAAAMMAAGVTAAAAPAHATTVSPYWQILTLGGNTYPVLECLQGDLGGPLGSSVTQHYCDPANTNPNQQWLPISTGGDGYKFQNVATHLCLEGRGGAANGTLVPLWDCTSAESNTRWAWDQSSPGADAFPGIEKIQSRVSGSTGYCLDVPGASTAIGLQVQLYRCNGTNAQYFWITKLDDH
jgi:Ricin-type beta-trefoil lectin domain-like